MKTRRVLNFHRPRPSTGSVRLALVLLLALGATGAQIGASTSPATFAIGPSSVMGGASVTATYQLAVPAPSSGVQFHLESSNPSIAPVPTWVTVPGGKTSFSVAIPTQPVSSSQSVTIKTFSDYSNPRLRLSASFTVTPPQQPAPVPSPTLSSVALGASSVVGGASLGGTVTLSSAAPSGGASVSVSSSKPSAASVPGTVTVAGGQSSASFTVSTYAVSSSTAVTISGSYGGAARSASLTINPQSTPSPSPLPSLSSLSLSPTSVTGGSTSQGTVRLSAAAPSGGATMSLASSSTLVAPVPASVSVAAGASSATFNISTKTVSASTQVSISASYSGKTLSAALTVAPASSSSTVSSFYLAPSGSDNNPCTQSAPCLSLDRAYHLAKPGNTVQMAGGSYPGQTITLDTSKVSASSDVSFGPAPGAAVKLASLDIYGSHISIHDLNVTADWYVGNNSNAVSYANQAHNVTLTNVNARNLMITAAYHVTVKGGSYGPAVDMNNQIKNCYLCTTPPPDDITLDGLSFHDFTRSSTSQHMECLEVYPATHFTLRNSRFYNCAIFDVFIANYGGQYPSNINIENNWFDAAGSHGGSLNAGYYSLYFRSGSGTISNLRIAYNSFIQSFAADPGSYTGTAVGNAVQGGLCIPGLTYSHNVMSARTCGSGDMQANPGFVSQTGFNLDLVTGSPCINRGDPASYPPRDIHGNGRPMGSAPDAGADEAG